MHGIITLLLGFGALVVAAPIPQGDAPPGCTRMPSGDFFCIGPGQPPGGPQMCDWDKPEVTDCYCTYGSPQPPGCIFIGPPLVRKEEQ
ncbi:hypothetical protein F5Y10DRAFT_253989 [Nemania abortiva]|nr:hypothetical protein F5Y10DRAFT_253989 [Nemania abortiva]